MLNVGLIDSLRVRVPMEHVAIIDKRIITDYIRYYPTLEALDGDENQEVFDEELIKAGPYTRIVNGITYRFFPKFFVGHDKMAHQYMVFQLSAKMCKHRYFDGITLQNLQQIVDDINALNVIKITLPKMLSGLVSDIDICINQKIDPKSLEHVFKIIQSSAQPSTLPLIRFIQKQNHKGQRNLGVDFNNREKATNSKPYIKIYHKGYELLSKSVEFYNKYLGPLSSEFLDNLVRYEFTIKAHKHKKYLQEKGLNADFKTLKDLLSTPMKDLKAIAQTGLLHYIEPRVNKKSKTDLSPMDAVLYHHVQLLIRLGAGEGEILGFTNAITDASSRSRTKTKVNAMIKKITDENKGLDRKLHENNVACDFLFNLGFNLPTLNLKQ